MRASFPNLDVEQVLSMRIHGVTPEFAQEVKAAGLGTPGPDE